MMRQPCQEESLPAHSTCATSRMLLRLARSALPAHRRDALLHLVPLLLATAVRAEALLRQLQGPLEGRGRADLDQLDHALLIGCKAHALTNHLTHVGDALAQAPFATSWTWRHLAARHDEAADQTSSKPRPLGLWLLVLPQGLPHVAGNLNFECLNVLA